MASTYPQRITGSNTTQFCNEVFKSLYSQQKAGSLCDLTLIVGGKHYRVHTVLIAAVSSVLEEQILGLGTETSLELPAKYSSVMDIVLEFLYTGILPTTEDGDLVLQFAEEYKVKHLAANVRKVTSEERGSYVYKSDILRKWNKYRQSGELSDFILKVEKQNLQCHKCILAAVCDYFHVMLTSNMIESTEGEVILHGISDMGRSTEGEAILHGISADGCETAIDYIYTGNFAEDSDVGCVLNAACYLQIPSLIDNCTRCLQQNLNIWNCVSAYQISILFSLATLEQSAEEFIIKFFEEIEEAQFMELQFKELVSFLRNDGIQITSELTLYKLLIKWCKYDETRTKYLDELIGFVRLPLITREDLKVGVVKEKLTSQSKICTQYLDEALAYHSCVYQQPILQTPKSQQRPCNASMKLITLDLKCNSAISGVDITQSQLRIKKITHKPSLVKNPGVIVMSDFLYVIGGQYANNEMCSRHAYRYDPRFNTWLQLQPLKTGRCKFFLGVADNKLYAVGGIVQRNKRNRILTKSVEKYDPEDNSWSYQSPYCTELYGLAGATFNGKLYTSGGKAGNTCYDKLLCYSPDVNSWENKSPMRTRGVYGHSMMTIDERIYVIGGKSVSQTSFSVDHLGVFKYDPLIDEWEFVTRIPKLSIIRYSRATAYGCNIYIIRQRRCQWNESKFILVYDVKMKTWDLKPLPSNFTTGTLCFLMC
ncbi:kelch-like protein 32 [Glandiceps talaboti]